MSAENPTVEYRNIPDFPGYRVGDDGSVWSLWEKKTWQGYTLGSTWRQLAGGTDKDGYRKLILCNTAGRRYVRVHVLVLRAFVGDPPPGHYGCHNNGRRDDNRLSNLRWDTASGNMADKVAHGTSARGSQNIRARFSAEQIKNIRARVAAGEKVARLAKEYDAKISTIGNIVRRRSWKWL